MRYISLYKDIRDKFVFFFRNHVPVTFYILFHLNNLFIVVNSSITFVVWYCVDRDFRRKAMDILNEVKERVLDILLKICKPLSICMPEKE